MIPATMRQIAERVAEEHGLTMASIFGRSRVGPVARARQEAMHACWSEHRWSLHQIGGFFRRDHSTVLHAAQKIEAEPKSPGLEDAA